MRTTTDLGGNVLSAADIVAAAEAASRAAHEDPDERILQELLLVGDIWGAVAWKELVMEPKLRVATNPPFDPLQAGWVPCPDCRGRKHSLWVSISSPDEFDIEDCPACDGLGIVVGPPADGLEIARKVRAQDLRWPIAPTSSTFDLIRRANSLTQ